jgi:hypothetical protein
VPGWSLKDAEENARLATQFNAAQLEDVPFPSSHEYTPQEDADCEQSLDEMFSPEWRSHPEDAIAILQKRIRAQHRIQGLGIGNPPVA